MTREEVYEKLDSAYFAPDISLCREEIHALMECRMDTDFDEFVGCLAEDMIVSNLFMQQAHKLVSKDFLTLKEALVYLGMKSARNIIVFFVVNLFYRDVTKKDERLFGPEEHWLHALGTAFAADALARELACPESATLFTCGLLHDVGILALDNYMREEMDRIYAFCEDGVHMTLSEKIVLGGVTHGEIGGWLCERWGLSPEMVEIVRFHHTPLLLKDPGKALLILYTADIISSMHHHALLGINENSRVVDPRVLALLGIDEELMDYIGEEIPFKVQRFRESYGSLCAEACS